MNKTVSAIITTHNRQELMVRAVKSVLCQTYKNIELIVVDDSSDERADELLKDFNLQYIYIPKEKSKGGNHARNIGILTAKGEYVAFLDDDDYWLPTKIEKQVALIEEKKCGLVYCGRIKEYIKNEKSTYSNVLPNSKNCGDMSKRILQVIPVTTSVMVVDKKILLDVGLFDENLNFWQEYELTIRLAQKTCFYFINECLTVYRIDEQDKNRLTNKFFKWKNAVKYIQKKHQSLYKQQTFNDKLITKQLIWRDARYRCNTSGLRYRSKYYSLLLILSKKIIKEI